MSTIHPRYLVPVTAQGAFVYKQSARRSSWRIGSYTKRKWRRKRHLLNWIIDGLQNRWAGWEVGDKHIIEHIKIELRVNSESWRVNQ